MPIKVYIRQEEYTEPVGHIVVLGSPAPVEVRVAVDPLEVFRSHVEHTADQLLVGQPTTTT